jgi:hypothetical protein
MEKRYQVFVSSTYNDLQEERALVFQTLMEMDCFPAGMELFPAADEEQWEFIRKIIDDCDYYLVIIAGRYGSTITPQGLSYTEKEYDYAIEKGMKVLAFVHEDPGKLAVDKSDINEELRTRLSAFRDRVKSGHIVKFWKMGADLPGLVALSLIKTIKSHPSVGWVRANQVGSAQLLSELNELRKRNQELERIVGEITPVGAGGVPEDLAGLDHRLDLRGSYTPHRGSQKVAWIYSATWGQLFALIAPELLDGRMDNPVKDDIEQLIFKKLNLNGHSPSIEEEDFQTIKIQFMALGLVKYERMLWSLPSKGKVTMMELRSVRSKPEL